MEMGRFAVSNNFVMAYRHTPELLTKTFTIDSSRNSVRHHFSEMSKNTFR